MLCDPCRFGSPWIVEDHGRAPTSLGVLQAEGKSLSRRNGELEATVRKLRSVQRDMEGERDRLLSRIQALESQVQS